MISASQSRTPAYLPEELTARFEALAPELRAAGLLTSGDVDLLAKYLIAEHEYLRVTNKVTAAISRGDAQDAAAWVGIQDKLLRQCVTAGAEFGLTPSSRHRLGLKGS